MKINYLIDFDSTFTQVEALDELAALVLQNHPNRNSILEEISHITNLAMQGNMSFDMALSKRIALLSFTRNDIIQLTNILLTKVSVSFVRNIEWLQTHAENIYIISGGFKEFIVPVVNKFGILQNHVFANDFIFDIDEKVIGFDTENLLSQAQGKVKLVKQLQLQGRTIVIGDGYTDYEIKLSGLANEFYLYTENVYRNALVEKADRIVKTIDEIINEDL